MPKARAKGARMGMQHEQYLVEAKGNKHHHGHEAKDGAHGHEHHQHQHHKHHPKHHAPLERQHNHHLGGHNHAHARDRLHTHDDDDDGHHHKHGFMEYDLARLRHGHSGSEDEVEHEDGDEQHHPHHPHPHHPHNHHHGHKHHEDGDGSAGAAAGGFPGLLVDVVVGGGEEPPLEPEPEPEPAPHPFELAAAGTPVSPTTPSAPPSAAKTIAIDKLRRELFKISQKHWKHIGWDDGLVPCLEQGFSEEHLVGVVAALAESRHMPLEELWEQLRNANDTPLEPREIRAGLTVQHIGDLHHPGGGADKSGYGIGVALGKPDKKDRVWVDFSATGATGDGPPVVLLPCASHQRRRDDPKHAEASLKRPGPPGLKMCLALLRRKCEKLCRQRGVLWDDAVVAIKEISNGDVLELVVGEMEEPGSFVMRLLAGVPLAKVNSSIIPGNRIRTERGELDRNQIGLVVENRAPIHRLPSRDNSLLKPGRLREYLDNTFGRKDGTPGLYGPNSACRKIYEPYIIQRSTEYLREHNLDEVDGRGNLLYARQEKISINFCGMGIARERLAAAKHQLDQTIRELGCDCTPACGSEGFVRGAKHENKERPDSTVATVRAREEECKYWEAALRLSTYGWAIDDQSMKEFAPLLPFVPNLGCLRLCDNKIGDRGMEALCQRLPMCVDELTGVSGIVTLELLGNHIGDDGIQHLANALPCMVELQELYLQNNRFREIGCLCASLPQCEQLRDLQLGGNRIDCAGAEALARVLQACSGTRKPGLSVIGLSGNGIGDDGARALACVLPGCRRLRKLRMQMNGFRERDEGSPDGVGVSATVRVNDSRQLVIQSKCKGGASRVQPCKVNSSGERAQKLLGIDTGQAKMIKGEGPPSTGEPAELIGGSFEPWDFGGVGEEEELHLVLDTPPERHVGEPRTEGGDKMYAKRLANHTRTVKFFVNVAFVDVAETVLAAYLYADGRTALEALKPGWLVLDLDPRRPPRPT